MDNELVSVFYAGQDVTQKVSGGAFNNWGDVKHIMLRQIPGAWFVLTGFDYESGSCNTAGFAIKCWGHNRALLNNPDQWEAYGSHQSTGPGHKRGHGVGWTRPCVSSSGFSLKGVLLQEQSQRIHAPAVSDIFAEAAKESFQSNQTEESDEDLLLTSVGTQSQESEESKQQASSNASLGIRHAFHSHQKMHHVKHPVPPVKMWSGRKWGAFRWKTPGSPYVREPPRPPPPPPPAAASPASPQAPAAQAPVAQVPKPLPAPTPLVIPPLPQELKKALPLGVGPAAEKPRLPPNCGKTIEVEGVDNQIMKLMMSEQAISARTHRLFQKVVEVTSGIPCSKMEVVPLHIVRRLKRVLKQPFQEVLRPAFLRWLTNHWNWPEGTHRHPKCRRMSCWKKALPKAIIQKLSGDQLRILGQADNLLQQIEKGEGLDAKSEYSKIWAVDSDGFVYKANYDEHGEWTMVKGKMNSVTQSDHHVWGISKDGVVMSCADPCTGEFTLAGGPKMLYLDAGEHRVFGVDSEYKVWKRGFQAEDKWEEVPGTKLKMISASKGALFGINTNNRVVQCALPCIGEWSLVSSNGVPSLVLPRPSFLQLASNLTGFKAHATAGGNGTEQWSLGIRNALRGAMKTVGGVLNRVGLGTPAATASFGSEGASSAADPNKDIENRLVQLDAGTTEIWAVNLLGHVYKRARLATEDWSEVRGKLLKHVSVGNGFIWGTTQSDTIVRCKQPCQGSWEDIFGLAKLVDSGPETKTLNIAPRGLEAEQGGDFIPRGESAAKRLHEQLQKIPFGLRMLLQTPYHEVLSKTLRTQFGRFIRCQHSRREEIGAAKKAKEEQDRLMALEEVHMLEHETREISHKTWEAKQHTKHLAALIKANAKTAIIAHRDTIRAHMAYRRAAQAQSLNDAAARKAEEEAESKKVVDDAKREEALQQELSQLKLQQDRMKKEQQEIVAEAKAKFAKREARRAKRRVKNCQKNGKRRAKVAQAMEEREHVRRQQFRLVAKRLKLLKAIMLKNIEKRHERKAAQEVRRLRKELLRKLMNPPNINVKVETTGPVLAESDKPKTVVEPASGPSTEM